MLLCSTCHGQNFGFNNPDNFKVGERDTVKVIMLLFDTAADDKRFVLIKNSVPGARFNTFSVFGYSVSEFIAGLPMVKGYWRHVEYLDERKRTLAKSVIVWQSMDAK